MMIVVPKLEFVAELILSCKQAHEDKAAFHVVICVGGNRPLDSPVYGAQEMVFTGAPAIAKCPVVHADPRPVYKPERGVKVFLDLCEICCGVAIPACR